MGYELPTVYVVGNDREFTESLVAFLSSMNVFVEFCRLDLESFFERRRRTGILILDVELAGSSGIEVLENQRPWGNAIPTIVLLEYANESLVARAAAMEGVEVLKKPLVAGEFLQAVRKGIEIDSKRCRRRELKSRVSELNIQERTLLTGLVFGKTNAMIAADLDVSPRTVQFRRKTLFGKLGVSSKVELLKTVLAEWQLPDVG